MKQLELELGKEIIYPVYISPTALERKPDEVGGITLKNEKEIFIEKPFQKNQSTQTELGVSEITGLDKEKNKVQLLLNKTHSLRTEKKDLLTKISEFEKGDNLSQQSILNLQNEV